MSNQTNKITELKKSLDVLEPLDLEAVKRALSLVGEAPAQDTSSPVTTDDFEKGKAYFIRTVTMYQVGRVTKSNHRFVTLEDAAWVADTGRFSDALKTGEFNEVEPVIGPYSIAVGAIVDFCEWPHKLPLGKK